MATPFRSFIRGFILKPMIFARDVFSAVFGDTPLSEARRKRRSKKNKTVRKGGYS